MNNNPLGISISQSDFNELVNSYLGKIKENKGSFSKEEFVTMTRIWNTIEVNQMHKLNDANQAFVDAFYPNLYREATVALGAKLSKGMAMYSEEYDLWFGGKPHQNSQYKIE